MNLANKYNIQFSTPDLEKRFYEVVGKDRDIQKLQRKYDEYMAKRQFVQAVQMKEKLNALYQKAFEIYIKDAQEEAKKINVNQLNLPFELKNRMNILYIAAFMTADLLESCVLDMNDAIKKFDSTLSVEIFDDLREANKKAKEKLKFLQESEEVMNLNTWGVQCDNMYKMLCNKAEKIFKENIKEHLK